MSLRDVLGPRLGGTVSGVTEPAADATDPVDILVSAYPNEDDRVQVAKDIRRLFASAAWGHVRQLAIVYHNATAQFGLRDAGRPRDYYVGRQDGVEQFLALVQGVPAMVAEETAPQKQKRGPTRAAAATTTFSEGSGLTEE